MNFYHKRCIFLVLLSFFLTNSYGQTYIADAPCKWVDHGNPDWEYKKCEGNCPTKDWVCQSSNSEDEDIIYCRCTKTLGEKRAVVNVQNKSIASGIIKYDNSNFGIYIEKVDESNDPIWMKKYGTIGYNSGWGISADQMGNSIMVGEMQNTVYFETIPLVSIGNSDIFAVKNDENGNELWVKQFGGTGKDVGKDIITDAQGNSYITGWYMADAQFGNIFLPHSGTGGDAFLLKLNSNGNVDWVRAIGGLGDDKGNGISLDGQGDILVTGYFSGTANFESEVLESINGKSQFIAKYKADGNLVWAISYEGAEGVALVVDEQNNVFSIAKLADNMLLLKLNTSGNLLHLKTYEGSGYVEANDISIKENGKLIVIGQFTGSFLIDGQLLESQGNQDVFLAEFNSNLLSDWAIREGGTSMDYAISVDNSKTGYTSYVGCTFGTSTIGGITQTGDNIPYARRLEDLNTVATNDQNGLQSVLAIRPNPFADNIAIDLNTLQAETLNIKLIDLLGRTIYEEEYKASTGRQTVSIALDEDMPTGIYLLQIVDENGGRHTEKLVKN